MSNQPFLKLPSGAAGSLGQPSVPVSPTPAKGAVALPARESFGSAAPKIVTVLPGGLCVTQRTDVVLATVLGSCGAVCLCDPQAGVGGMNHFLLPEPLLGPHAVATPEEALRYGRQSIDALVAAVLEQGAQWGRLEAKVFGGANVLHGVRGPGHGNADFALAYLNELGIRVAAADVKGEAARKLHFYPTTGRARVLALGNPPSRSTGAGSPPRHLERRAR